MNNASVKNAIESARSVDVKIGTKTTKDKFSKLKNISSDNVVKVLADTGKTFMKGDVVKIEDNVAKFFTGSETASDDMVPGIVIIGNWQTDGYEYVYVLTGGVEYVYVTEEINAGEKLYPADDETTPTPVKRFVKKAGESDIPYWVALEHSDAESFVKVKFLTQGSGSGGSTEYGAMFKVISDDLAIPSVKIIDGRRPTSAHCGSAIVSDIALEIESVIVAIPVAFIADLDPPDGYLVLYYHIHLPGSDPWIWAGKDDASQATPFEILTQLAFESPQPNAYCGRTLIARVSATPLASPHVISITQEHHGAVYGTIFGPCP